MNPADIKTLVEEEVRTEIFHPAIDKLDKGLFVEIGTFIGGNICRVGNYIREHNKDIKIIGIDNFEFANISGPSFTWAEVSQQEDFYARFLSNVDECGLGDIISHIKSDSIESVPQFEDESIDLIFIDGTHGYEYCYKELLAWLPKIKTGGVISGHDWPYADMQKAIRGALGDRYISVTSTNGGYQTVK